MPTEAIFMQNSTGGTSIHALVMGQTGTTKTCAIIYVTVLQGVPTFANAKNQPENRSCARDRHGLAISWRNRG